MIGRTFKDIQGAYTFECSSTEERDAWLDAIAANQQQLLAPGSKTETETETETERDTEADTKSTLLDHSVELASTMP